MSGKSDKLQSHKKKTEKKSGESRKYAQVSCDSVSLTAEAIGISLSEDIAKQLAEDVSYRLREVIHNCSIHLRQNKRRRLSTGDVNAVFQTSDVPQIYGHLNNEPSKLLYIKEANVFVQDEQTVDLTELSLSDDKVSARGEPFLKGTWLSPDGINTLDANTSPQGKTEETKLATSNSEKCSTNPQIPAHLLSYYSHISKIILGNSENLLKVVLKDLESNCKIAPIAPYLLNLIALGLQKLPKGESHAHFRYRFLQTAEALTCNNNTELSGSISVHRVITTLLLCLLDATLIEGTSIRCNYELRNMAAVILAKVVNRWCFTDNKLQLDILQKLGSVLLDGTSSLRNHYTALRTVCALGYDALDYCLWPHLEQYLAFLDILKVQQDIEKIKKSSGIASLNEQSADMMEIEEAILTAAEMLYYKEWRNLQDHSPISRNTVVIEKLLEAYFGDTLCARRPYYPVAINKRDGVVGTNISNNTAGMEVDMQVSSVMKDTPSSDFELDYRNWTAIAKIPIHVPSLLVHSSRSLATSFSDRRLSMQCATGLTSAFDLPVRHKHYSNTIRFNFAGANPVSKRRLKRRILDPRHAQLMCPSDYFCRSCQLGSIGKLTKKNQKMSTMKSRSAYIMALL